MQTNQIKPATKNRKATRIGRGGKRGTFSGRGTKGQKARSGRKMRPELRDIIKRLPKKRGYRFHGFQVKPVVVNVGEIEKNFKDGEEVSAKVLVEKRLISKAKGLLPKIKLLGGGEISKKISVSGCVVSKSAKEKIEKAGGKIA